MKEKEIKKLRLKLGKILHEYYLKNGETKYEKFLKNISPKILKDYGEPFSEENLRIMEAEYVTFNTKIGDNNRTKNQKIIIK